MNRSVRENPVGGRSAWVRVVLVLGLATGLLLVWAARDATAQMAPNAPEKVFALTTGDRLLRFDGDEPRQVMGKTSGA
jgi:hypothetical protein